MEIRLMPIAGGDDSPISIEVIRDPKQNIPVVSIWQDDTPVWFNLSLTDLRRAINASEKAYKERQ